MNSILSTATFSTSFLSKSRVSFSSALLFNIYEIQVYGELPIKLIYLAGHWLPHLPANSGAALLEGHTDWADSKTCPSLGQTQ